MLKNCIAVQCPLVAGVILWWGVGGGGCPLTRCDCKDTVRPLGKLMYNGLMVVYSHLCFSVYRCEYSAKHVGIVN